MAGGKVVSKQLAELTHFLNRQFVALVAKAVERIVVFYHSPRERHRLALNIKYRQERLLALISDAGPTLPRFEGVRRRWDVDRDTD